ncbi:MAG TPA: hypothetical protein VM802_19015 [Chitinophaga sp.]|uniref:tetratricopeptide repeat protein n=1 Tax=Chitinophaga sp. TaxID=1869181 RepID=UPI002C67B3E8|nr:hypothetical protein [Chitinophaga sp.]HVI46978.1 hypothetical protein [Chitinophaga sp.]
MHFDELERLYNEQAYTLAATQLEIYLQTHSNEAPAWHLLGLCKLEMAKNVENNQEALETHTAAYEAFTQALIIDPTHIQARLYRAHTDAGFLYQYTDTTLSDCEYLISHGDTEVAIKARQYRYQVYMTLQDIEKGKAEMEHCLELYESLYRNNLPRLNVARFQCYTDIGDLYYYSSENHISLDYYKEAFKYAVHNNRSLATANFAILMNDHDFVAHMLPVILTGEENGSEELFRLLQSIKQLLDDGLQHAGLARAFCWGSVTYWQRFFGDDEYEGTLEQISLGKRFIAAYPQESYFYHYTATAFFNIGSYHESLPYYEKAINIRPYPSTIIRWYYANFRTTGALPDSWPDTDHIVPYDWYTAGVISSEIIQQEQDAAARNALLQVKKFLYRRSFQLYYSYWYENSGSSYAGHPHHYAMCCNNYGITLYELSDYEEAVRVHTIGYNMSPFWEQLESRADAYHSLGNAEAAVNDRKAILSSFTNTLPLMYYVSIHERIIEDLTSLERHEEALELYNKILGEYDTWIAREMEELDNYERDTITYNIDRIKTGRAFIRSGSANDLAERIRALEMHLEEKPDDSDAYFNLMYLYFDNGQYEHCIGAINNRISIGGITQLPVVSQMKIYYFRGKAALKLHRYKACIADMLLTLNIMRQGDDSDNSPNNRVGVYAFLSEAYLGEHDYKTSIDYGQQCMQIYKGMNWSWDKEASSFYYTTALAYEAHGDTAACRKLIDRILEHDAVFQPAVDKKAVLKGNGGGFFSFFKKKKQP